MDSEDREELRYTLRRHLASRPTAALTLDMLRHAMHMKGLKASDEDIKNELTYWTGTEPQQVKTVLPEHGSTIGYQITSAGRLAVDRGQ